MLRCKIQDKILDYDFMLDSLKTLDENQLNNTIKVLIDNCFTYLGTGTLMDNETPREHNRFHFFKRQFGEPEAIYQSARKIIPAYLEQALFANYSSTCYLPRLFNDSDLKLNSIRQLHYKESKIELKDDFYVDIPQRTPQGRTPKQHKLIMEFNKRGKRN
jgi:hypothetical protein